MKKVILMFLVIGSVAFISCGGDQREDAGQDTTNTVQPAEPEVQPETTTPTTPPDTAGDTTNIGADTTNNAAPEDGRGNNQMQRNDEPNAGEKR